MLEFLGLAASKGHIFSQLAVLGMEALRLVSVKLEWKFHINAREPTSSLNITSSLGLDRNRGFGHNKGIGSSWFCGPSTNSTHDPYETKTRIGQIHKGKVVFVITYKLWQTKETCWEIHEKPTNWKPRQNRTRLSSFISIPKNSWWLELRGNLKSKTIG